MFEFSEVQLEHIVVHHVGNKGRDEGFRLSKEELMLKEELVLDVLMKYFLSPFKEDVFYNFTHNDDLQFNEIYTFIAELFEQPETFFEQSKRIARHLYQCSQHPQIKGGEFYLTYFENCVVDGELIDAIGLFKSENKDTFLKVYEQNEQFEVDAQDGINIKRLDKGCIIFNTEKEMGYKVAMVDNTNQQEAAYWKDEFLKLKIREDDFYHTQSQLSICQGFVEDVLGRDEGMEKPEQIEMLNKSVQYFKENESFNARDFEREVIEKPDVIASFQEYKQEFTAAHQVEVPEEFEVSDKAVKGEQKKVKGKSVLKLDKNFQVYVKGDPMLMEKGYDETRGMNFYKLFFNEES